MLKKLDQEMIDRLSKIGAEVSKRCRDVWTGEQTGTAIRINSLSFGGRRDVAYLDLLGLLGLEDVADLFQARLRIDGQHSWNREDWKKEILKANGQS